MTCCQFLITIKTFLVGRSDHVHYRYCWVDIGFDAVVDMVVYISADVWLIYWSSITHYLKKKKKKLVLH